MTEDEPEKRFKRWGRVEAFVACLDQYLDQRLGRQRASLHMIRETRDLLLEKLMELIDD